MWDNDEMIGDEEQVVRSLSGNEYSMEDWVFCIQCDEVLQIRDLTDGDDGWDYCPKCGAGGIDQDIFSVDSDMASDEIREVYKQKREDREATTDEEYVEEEEDEESAYDDDWLFDGRDE